MGDTIAQTRFENVSKLSNDPLLVRGNTLQSGEDSLKLKELMELCTNLQQMVLGLEKTKTTQAKKIVIFKRRVKKLEHKKRSRTHGLKRLYKVGLTARVESSRDEESLGKDASKQGRINAIDADEDITLVNDQDDQDDADMFDVNTLTGDEVFVEQEVAAKDVILTVDKVTLAQALAALKSVKPKVKANVVIGQVYQLVLPVQRLLLLQLQQLLQFQLQGKELSLLSWVHLQQQQQFLHNHHKQKFRTKAGILVKEPVKPKKKDLIRLDEEISLKLQAEFDEEERLAREKDEANVALTEE
ncbi:hypothetical protein Tco_0128584 [Tanacetum coccineum]